jgi:hypothetical protein
LSASSTHSPALLTTVGCLALVFAAVAVAAICWNWSRQYKLLGLPIAPGTMTRCEPLLTTTSAAANIGTPAVSPVWTVITRYSYSVNGVAHEGVNISNLAPRKIVGGARIQAPSRQRVSLQFATNIARERKLAFTTNRMIQPGVSSISHPRFGTGRGSWCR